MWTVCGCGQDAASAANAKPTLNVEGLPIEQQIEKVRNDPSIPEQYKETYINSLKGKAGQK